MKNNDPRRFLPVVGSDTLLYVYLFVLHYVNVLLPMGMCIHTKIERSCTVLHIYNN
jgi:hypothetical protein